MTPELQRDVMNDKRYLINLTHRSTWALLRILDSIDDTLSVTSLLHVREQYRLRQARNVLMHTIDARIDSAKEYLKDFTIVSASGDLVKKPLHKLEWHDREKIHRMFDDIRALVWYKTFYKGVWL